MWTSYNVCILCVLVFPSNVNGFTVRSVATNPRTKTTKLFSSVVDEVKEASECVQAASEYLFKPDDSVTAEGIVKVCDEIDAIQENDLFVSQSLQLRKKALEFKRYEMLAKLMRSDYDAYVATASFLSPSRIPRLQLPNVQDVPMADQQDEPTKVSPIVEDGQTLVADCELEDMTFNDNLLDKVLLSIFRKLVVKNTGGVSSDKEGIEGLLDQGRTFMLQPGQTAEAQNKMVSDTLGDLMTPVLPPFYRIFMSGIVPKLGTDFDGKQIGPWFYAPWLTSFVTPTFFGFLVGPSYPNRRKDGQPGGLVVEKCKFLQESGCKGLCLNQCKLPAQQFFQDELGLPLTVSPNFVTQECQWSFGEVPLPPEDDPSFPKGCLVGCGSRKLISASAEGPTASLCN
uniref:Beta-carotene isomerase D27-like C-terminal domain-containing protein n=1 Tax=Asterionellopsis glacialis TaxID=33640 RepID=A0A7S0KZ14_9STRA|mmetsp:Transcript_1835/g.2650  ORF Transcript_1835/g.2650 Transcript_1835/m.2650 type:complete len:398 (+) Transcript_1835:128-1321(+)